MSAVFSSVLSAPPLAFLEGIGAMEMMLVAVIGLLLFGGKGLPDMARTVGKVVREFKKATASVENEVKRVMDEEPEPPRPRRKLTRPPASTPAATAPLPAPAVDSAALPPPTAQSAPAAPAAATPAAQRVSPPPPAAGDITPPQP